MVANAVVTDWPSGSANTGWPQEPTGMLMPGRVEGWPAGTQRAANAAERLLSQAVAYWDVGQYRDGDRFLRNRGTGGELLDLRLGSALEPNSNDPKFLSPENNGYVYFPGVALNFMEIPHEPAFVFTDDFSLRACIAMDDWSPSATTALMSKYNNNVTTDRSWEFIIGTSGLLGLVWTNTSQVVTTIASTVPIPVHDGAELWVRVDLDVDNGVGGHTATFYTSGNGFTWTQLGDPVTNAGSFIMQSSAMNLRCGHRAVGSFQMMTGKMYRAQIFSGTTVLDIDCDAITSGSATTFTALTGQTVTINRPTTGRKTVAVPSRSRGGRPVMLLGTDDYMEVQDNWQHGLLNFGQGDSFTVLTVLRQWATPPANSHIVSKSAGVTSQGWLVRTSGTYILTGFVVDVAAISQSFTAPTSGTGPVAAFTHVVNRNARQATGYLNGAAGTATALNLGAPSSNESMRVGRAAGASGNYTDMEFYGAAVFRRALSPAEITTLSNYFTGRIA